MVLQCIRLLLPCLQVPFVLGFFVLVQGLYVQGWVDKIAVGLGSAASGRSCRPASCRPGCWHDAHAGGDRMAPCSDCDCCECDGCVAAPPPPFRCAAGLGPALLMIGSLSIGAANFMNNQPMTVLFTEVLLAPAYEVAAGPAAHKASLFALIIGSNLVCGAGG